MIKWFTLKKKLARIGSFLRLYFIIISIDEILSYVGTLIYFKKKLNIWCINIEE